MRKALLILLVVFGVFLAIGCTGDQAGERNETGAGAAGTPEQAVTEVEVVTGAAAVTPVQEVVAVTETVEETPVTAVTPAVGVTGAEVTTVTEGAGAAVTAVERGTPGRAAVTPGRATTPATGGIVRVTPER